MFLKLKIVNTHNTGGEEGGVNIRPQQANFKNNFLIIMQNLTKMRDPPGNFSWESLPRHPQGKNLSYPFPPPGILTLTCIYEYVPCDERTPDNDEEADAGEGVER